VQDVIKNAKAINLPAQNHVLHAARQHFSCRWHGHIVNPVGDAGRARGSDVHVVHGNFNRLQNPFRGQGIATGVEAIVFNGLASSLALLRTSRRKWARW